MKGIFNLLLNLAKKNPYPVGSIYMSVNATDPSTLFGGTWERIKDTFLLSAGDTYANGSTGGEATHTLTTDEMPSHTHGVYDNSQSAVHPDYRAVAFKLTRTYISPAYSSTQGESENYIRKYGGNQPHNNLPPYLAVFVWKRTA